MVYWSSGIKIKPTLAASGRAAPDDGVTDANIIRAVAMLPPEKYDNISPCGRFFRGMKMLFSDNEAPWLGRRNNEECEAVALITHPNEPADDMTTPYRTLLYMPLGIIVRPLAVKVDDLNVEGLPSGCILVKPTTQKGGSTQVRA